MSLISLIMMCRARIFRRAQRSYSTEDAPAAASSATIGKGGGRAKYAIISYI